MGIKRESTSQPADSAHQPFLPQSCYIIQWCQSNFSSLEDIKTRRNRGDFRQNIESIEEMQCFHALLKRAFLG
jgi:hypothetical protein